MNSNDDDSLSIHHDEDRRLQSRVASMGTKVAELERTIGSMSNRIDGFQSTMATKEQLQNSSQMFTMQLAHQQSTLELKLTAFVTELSGKLEPIQRGIYYAVGIILTAFLSGVLGLVWFKP